MDRVFFITNLSRKLGYGHLKRCLNIADQLRGNYRIFFFKDKIKKKTEIPYKTLKLDKIQKLGITNKDIFILDIVEKEFSQNNFINKWREISKIYKTIIIDNDFSKNWKCSKKIYPYIKSKRKNYILSGINYFVFNKVINKLSERKARKKQNITVCMGGSDPKNFTYKIIKDFIRDKSNIKMNVITGPHMLDKSKNLIKKIIRKKPNLFFFDNPKNIYSLLAESNLAIINSGNIKYECAKIGTPFIMIANQKKDIKVCNEFVKKFKVIYPKDFMYKKNVINDLIVNYFNDKKKLQSITKFNKKIFSKKTINYLDIIKSL